MDFSPRYFLLKHTTSLLPRLVNVQRLAHRYGNAPSHLSQSRRALDENLRNALPDQSPGPHYECLIIKHVEMHFLSQRHVEAQPGVEYCIPLAVVGSEYMALGRNHILRLSSADRLVVRMAGFLSLCANLAFTLASLVHFWGTLVFDILLSLIRSPNASVLKDSTIWIGHGEKTPKDVDSLSELQMLREIYAGAIFPLIANVRNVRTVQREMDFVLLPRLSRMVDVAALTPSSVLRLLRISLSGILRARDFRILHELLTTALIAAILSRNTPKCVLSSTTFLHGEPTMYAAAHLKIRSVMLHYGINTLLPKLTTDTEDPREHLIMGRTLVTDHVVWDELHARWFREQYASSGHTAPMFHATGPLMFCSINFNFSYLRDRFTVGVFDVIPPSFIHSLQLGYGAGVYTMSAVEEFWNEIADCLSDLRIGSRELRVVIKQKRELNPRMHDARYQEHLEALQARAIGRFLEFRKPSENPWKTITSCDVVIGVPYTSMVSAADYLGLPACFFYPGNRVVKSQFKTPLLAGNRLELRQFLEAAVEGASRETPTLLPAPRLLQEVHDKVRSVIQA